MTRVMTSNPHYDLLTFWRWLNERIEIIGGCWMWTGPVNRPGPAYYRWYAAEWADPNEDTGCRPRAKYRGKMVYVHRLMLAWRTGVKLEDAPKAAQAHHVLDCDIRCVNPNHLEWTSAELNNRLNAYRTHALMRGEVPPTCVEVEPMEVVL